MKTPLSNGPDMKPAPLSNGPEANPLSKGPDKNPFKGPDPRGTGCKGTAANEAVLSNEAAGSWASPEASTFGLPVRAVEALALTEAPEIALKVVSDAPLLALWRPAKSSAAISCRKEALRVSESRVLESTV